MSVQWFLIMTKSKSGIDRWRYSLIIQLSFPVMSSSEKVADNSLETTPAQFDVDVTTRSGDKGTSCLYNGKRLPKSDIHFEALGSLDECNSFIGLSREYLSDSCKNVDVYLETIQCLLFDVCAAVATPLQQSRDNALSKTAFDECHVSELEEWSFTLNQELPKQDSFILPV